ncbi:DUF2066 domain-containing protein [Vibrio sonorensis]|uniref:DUF2066 domain-containing protein n=1 Tax=Vibrio sonorensis TaxID=1004316 RepID=UPI0008DAFD88|nr:DUF2066 domain-containing protein [Vibrio sonorensis]
MRYLALLMIGLMATPVMALTKVDLYQAEVVLNKDDSNPDAAARKEGMKQVLVRASGDTGVINNEVVAKALAQNSQYVSQLSYATKGGEQSLRMGFSGAHIRSLLSQAQLPFWPATRANVLVWIVEESQYERVITWEHSSSELLQELRDQAELRGLPITVPAGDFDDITGVSVTDLWGGFAQPLGQASQRYPVDAVLLLRAQGSTLRWSLYDQKPSTIGVTRQAPLSGSNNGVTAVSKMVNQVSDYFAKKSAVVVASESSETVKARFVGISTAYDFFTLENQLKSLSSVASLDILKIQGEQVTFNVHLLATRGDFSQEVSRLRNVKQLEDIVETSTVETNTFESTAYNDEIAPVLAETQPAESVEQAPELPVMESERILLFEWLTSQMSKPKVEVTEEVDPEFSEQAE